MEELIELLDRTAPAAVRTICKELKKHGHKTWIVGGCVRDTLMSAILPDSARSAGDWDLCTDAEPAQVSKIFRRVIATGILHGTVTVLLRGQHFEVTTLRGERGHSDGRRPDEVFFVADLAEDLARRDFTVNAMAFDVLGKTFHDPFGGLSDLKQRRLRAVGEPARRFAEDGLRVLRLARFCATLEFAIEEQTRAAIFPSLSSFEKIAQERVRDEWFKALRAARPSRFLDVIHREKILRVTAPQLQAAPALWTESATRRVDRAPPDPVLRLALVCLLFSAEPARETARYVAKRLRLSRQEATRLNALCQHATVPPAVWDQTDSGAGRRFLAEVGRELFPEVKLVQESVVEDEDFPRLREAHRWLDELLSHDPPLSLKELAVDGGSLMEQAGVPRGPAVGRMLQALLDEVLEHPELNNRERLLALARQRRDTEP